MARWNPPMVLGGQASNPSSRQDLESVYPPSSSEHKENAKLQVAKAALKELYYNPYDKMDVESVPLQRKRKNAESIPFQKKKMDVEFDQTKESEGAKQKLNELCQREKWPKPTYRCCQGFSASVAITLNDEADSRGRCNLELNLTQFAECKDVAARNRSEVFQIVW
ncbi:hypothetical protein BC332_30991 [Capsicum chinense]|nr:hypothetical protein BC332_30991 [Capsicum chinense]